MDTVQVIMSFRVFIPFIGASQSKISSRFTSFDTDAILLLVAIVVIYKGE